ncbi:MAG: hypothetical protein KGD64_07765 [Candidatus Heimdallarchaeota archaeon]|nr:hypothetical protein [Candidatus Heimdallarchaeota archaeon]
MTKIWGYTPSATLPSPKILGSEIKVIKQVFSALLFRDGVKGVCVQIEDSMDSARVKIQLIIDDDVILTSYFSPTEKKEYDFTMEKIVIPKVKIEVLFVIESGTVILSVSAIGSGMGFQQIGGEYTPTNHFSLGLIIP